MDPNALQAVCHTAVEFASLTAEDHLFFPRANASSAYVITSGTATYMLESHIAGCLGDMEQEVRPGQFFCEVALWCNWKHVGELVATMACELLAISRGGLT